jgi:hypothetical protein
MFLLVVTETKVFSITKTEITVIDIKKRGIWEIPILAPIVAIQSRNARPTNGESDTGKILFREIAFKEITVKYPIRKSIKRKKSDETIKFAYI